MGKGDKKSAKGKRWRGSFGKARNKKGIKARLARVASVKVASETASTGAAKPKRTTRKKTE